MNANPGRGHGKKHHGLQRQSQYRHIVFNRGDVARNGNAVPQPRTYTAQPNGKGPSKWAVSAGSPTAGGATAFPGEHDGAATQPHSSPTQNYRRTNFTVLPKQLEWGYIPRISSPVWDALLPLDSQQRQRITTEMNQLMAACTNNAHLMSPAQLHEGRHRLQKLGKRVELIDVTEAEIKKRKQQQARHSTVLQCERVEPSTLPKLEEQDYSDTSDADVDADMDMDMDMNMDVDMGVNADSDSEVDSDSESESDDGKPQEEGGTSPNAVPPSRSTSKAFSTPMSVMRMAPQKPSRTPTFFTANPRSSNDNAKGARKTSSAEAVLAKDTKKEEEVRGYDYAVGEGNDTCYTFRRGLGTTSGSRVADVTSLLMSRSSHRPNIPRVTVNDLARLMKDDNHHQDSQQWLYSDEQNGSYEDTDTGTVAVPITNPLSPSHSAYSGYQHTLASTVTRSAFAGNASVAPEQRRGSAPIAAQPPSAPARRPHSGGTYHSAFTTGGQPSSRPTNDTQSRLSWSAKRSTASTKANPGQPPSKPGLLSGNNDDEFGNFARMEDHVHGGYGTRGVPQRESGTAGAGVRHPKQSARPPTHAARKPTKSVERPPGSAHKGKAKPKKPKEMAMFSAFLTGS